MTIPTGTLQRFCAGPLEARLWLQRPYRQDGRIFAANGALFVSIPDDGRPIDAPHEHEAPHMARAMPSLPKGDGMAIPDLPAAEPCAECRGNCFATYGPFFECVGLDGKLDPGIEVGPARFQTRLLRLLQTLPGVVIVPGADHRSMAGIRFDGGLGGLMPLKRPEA